MGSSSVAERKKAFSEVIAAFNAASAGVITDIVSGSHLPQTDHAYQALADIIRAVDPLIEDIRADTPEVQELLAETCAMATALRRAAFLAIAQVNPDQAWFWTERWQAKEREADADIASGNVRHFESDADFLAELAAIDA